MITKLDNSLFGSCDGIARRNFLQIGAIAGLSLPQLLKAEKAFGAGSSNKSVIMVYLAGVLPISTPLIPRTTRHPRFRASSIRFRRLLPGCVFPNVFPA